MAKNISENSGAAEETQPPHTIATREQWDEWLTLYASRNEVAVEYARLLGFEEAGWPGWRELNAAILRRWSPAGLSYIKEKAWRFAHRAQASALGGEGAATTTAKPSPKEPTDE